MLFMLIFYNDLNLVDDYFNALNINLCCNYKLDFKLMLILPCSRLLQALI